MSMCMKITRPGVLEIKGPYPSSPLFYIRTETLQGFVVNHRASTIELLFTTGFPSKIIDFTSGQLSSAVDLLTDFISQKSASMVMNERAEPHRYISSLDAKEVHERLTYVESVMKKVPMIQENTSVLSSSIQQIYRMSMQLRRDLDDMKKTGADDAVTEVECNENDGCDCECYAEKPPEEPASNCAPTKFELFLALLGTSIMLAGFTVMSMPLIYHG